MKSVVRRGLLLGLLTWLVACGGTADQTPPQAFEGEGDGDSSTPTVTGDGDVDESRYPIRTDREAAVPSNAEACEPGSANLGPAPDGLQWKRGEVFVRDIARALSLSADEVCTEIDGRACADVHGVPLGRADPFASGLLRPVARPLATTTITQERLVLAACSQRAAQDAAGEAQLFTHVDLSAAALDGTDVATREAIEADVTTLYRRMLSRDPTADELTVVAELAADPEAPIDGLSFAKLACFAVGTTSEFVLF